MERQHRPWTGVGRLALAAALVAAIATLPACKKTAVTTAPTETSATASSTVTPKLDPSKLPQMQEGLLFDYVQAGGIPALEAAFGKPTGSFTTYAEGPPGGSYELKDGRVYRFEWGFDAAGKAVVMGHTVEAQTGQSLTAKDKAFVDAIVDGKTLVAEADRYLRSVGGAAAVAAKVDPKALKVPAHLWKLKDGSGFIVVDLTGLTAEQMKAIGMEDQGPYQAVYWGPSHFRAY